MCWKCDLVNFFIPVGATIFAVISMFLILVFGALIAP